MIFDEYSFCFNLNDQTLTLKNIFHDLQCDKFSTKSFTFKNYWNIMIIKFFFNNNTNVSKFKTKFATIFTNAAFKNKLFKKIYMSKIKWKTLSNVSNDNNKNESFDKNLFVQNELTIMILSCEINDQKSH